MNIPGDYISDEIKFRQRFIDVNYLRKISLQAIVNDDFPILDYYIIHLW